MSTTTEECRTCAPQPCRSDRHGEVERIYDARLKGLEDLYDKRLEGIVAARKFDEALAATAAICERSPVTILAHLQKAEFKLLYQRALRQARYEAELAKARERQA